MGLGHDCLGHKLTPYGPVQKYCLENGLLQRIGCDMKWTQDILWLFFFKVLT